MVAQPLPLAPLAPALHTGRCRRLLPWGLMPLGFSGS